MSLNFLQTQLYQLRTKTVLLLSNLYAFSCFVALVRTSSTVLSRSDESGHLCLIPNLRGESNWYFMVKYEASCRFFVNALYQIGKVFFYF